MPGATLVENAERRERVNRFLTFLHQVTSVAFAFCFLSRKEMVELPREGLSDIRPAFFQGHYDSSLLRGTSWPATHGGIEDSGRAS